MKPRWYVKIGEKIVGLKKKPAGNRILGRRGRMTDPENIERHQVHQFDPKHPEKGWHPAEPWQGRTTYRHWPWLQRLVDWLWRVKR
jgi:hypothetical protein